MSAGLRYGEFKSSISGDLNGVPDLNVPDGWNFPQKYPTTFHHYTASFDGQREFKGAGPTVSWDASRRLLGQEEAGHVNLDWNVTGGMLFGKQKTSFKGVETSAYSVGAYPGYGHHWTDLPVGTQTPINIQRDKSVAVPLVDLSLGLSVATPGVKLSGGYRWERYFNVLDAGFEQHKSYDRIIDGPYLKIAVGFGG